MGVKDYRYLMPADTLAASNAVGIPKIKNGSTIKIGEDYSLTINVDQRFNWFQKKMIKLCFGFEVQDYSEE